MYFEELIERDLFCKAWLEEFYDLRDWVERSSHDTEEHSKKEWLNKNNYCEYDFNSDHLEPITRIEGTSIPNFCINRSSYVKLDRLSNTIWYKDYEGKELVFSIKIRVPEEVTECFFITLEHCHLSKSELIKENQQSNNHVVDGISAFGSVTWNMNEIIPFTRESVGLEDCKVACVSGWIEAAKQMIKNSLDSVL